MPVRMLSVGHPRGGANACLTKSFCQRTRWQKHQSSHDKIVKKVQMSQQSRLSSISYNTGHTWPWSFWGQWIVANALAETVGLGASALLWIAFLFGVEQRYGVLVSAVVVVLGSTLLEGAAVGFAQWWVLHKALPQMRWQAWFVATAIGAFMAWTLGMIPSTALSLSAETSAGPPPEVNNWLVYSLAALMGIVLGPVLGAPQWWVLRRFVRDAWWWVPAQSAAWAAGMVAIFVGVSMIPAEGGVTAVIVLIVLGSLAVAGALVGAIHGVVLVWLLRRTYRSANKAG